MAGCCSSRRVKAALPTCWGGGLGQEMLGGGLSPVLVTGACLDQRCHPGSVPWGQGAARIPGFAGGSPCVGSAPYPGDGGDVPQSSSAADPPPPPPQNASLNQRPVWTRGLPGSASPSAGPAAAVIDAKPVYK